MPSVLENICVSVTSGECLVGILVNGFIGLVNCIDCVKTTRVTSIDFILTGLAISRTGMLLALISMNFFDFFYFKISVIGIWKFSEIIWHLSNHSSAWFGSCLSIFYFLKIANFSHPAFLWLKWRINKVVLRMLMGCWLISLFIILPMTERIIKIWVVLIDQENKTNITHNNQGLKTLKFFILILFNTGGLVPFALSVVSCLLLVLSLRKHMQQMHLKVTGSRDPSTEAHVRAMKTIMTFLFLFVLYHLGLIMANLNTTIFRSKLVSMFSLTVMSVYPMTHSIILILGHSKLRQASLRVLEAQRLSQSPWESLSGRD
ncbi:LOW QUALITY PROTEIN: taste receptor type 2 member 7-like [Vombatus ursinus]|uniref:LOW QUALITY PROTEIN: taste receptor type 2 member 7-like n=1 Tax=Vombatus ursinus TaxID=29139 RepID=UPI000FFD64B4|nr:LOW QUALITY PROTEIN: taste receptor type 2 member 7-like [Vombatus ursinus]